MREEDYYTAECMSLITRENKEGSSANHTQDTAPKGGQPERPSENSLHLSEALHGYLDFLRVEEGRTQGTLIRYRACLEQLIQLVGDQPAGELDGESVSHYKRHLLEAGLSPVTIGGRLSCLRSFLRYLRDVRHLQVFDAEKIRRPKIPKREVEYMTKDEVQRFLRAIPVNSLVGLRDRALVEVFCSTGMRISEALSLDRGSIDWEVGEARIVGKGNKERKVYFNHTALDWLGQYLDQRWDSNAALFVTDGHEPRRMKAAGTWKKFRRYGRLADIGRNVYPHMLRHTMATTLLANGCPIGHIRVLLGHAQLATTCRYYLGVLSDREAKVAHAKYLSYETGEGEESGELSPRQQNGINNLTENYRRVESV